MDQTVVPTSLANIGKGKLEKQFQECLPEISEVFEEAHKYETTKDGEVVVTITLQIEMVKPRESAVLNVGTRVTVKKPKERMLGTQLYYAAGTFTTPMLSQGEMFPLGVARKPIVRPDGAEE